VIYDSRRNLRYRPLESFVVSEPTEEMFDTHVIVLLF
jgi:hypothetical protein